MTELTVDSAHVVFVRILDKLGRWAPTARRLEIQEPIANDGETDCWTHAWQVAQRTPNARYVEGLCRRSPGRTDKATHAWVEVDGPFGAMVVETTPGYENASLYRGLVVDHTPGGFVDRETRDAWPPGIRGSVIQAYLQGGASLNEILAVVEPD